MKRLAALLVLGICAVGPAAAHGSVAYIDENGVAAAEGEPGQANDMSAALGGDGEVVLTDTAGIRPRDEFGCRVLSETSVACLSDGGALLLGGDGDDTLRDAGLTTGFGARGGPGGDTIVAGAARALVYGDERRVSASDGDDRITGSSAAVAGSDDFDDMLNGGGGNDQIDAGAGNDTASGQAGNDTVNGGDGDDNLDSTSLFTDDDVDAPGDAGDDVLSGDAGNDQLRGIGGRDTVLGGDGDDRVLVTDLDLGRDDGSVDTVSCGAGTDRFAPGFSDRIALGCERALVAVDCAKNYPCAVTGSVFGYKKGSKKPTSIGRVSTTINSPQPVEIKIGGSAKKVLGPAKKTFLSVDLLGRRGKKVVAGGFFRFYLTK